MGQMPDPLCAFVGQGAALTAAAWAAAAANADGDADELFAYARPPTKRERLEKGERRAEQHQGWADAPKEKRRRAAEESIKTKGAYGVFFLKAMVNQSQREKWWSINMCL